jgi:hypothetical protein
MGLMVFLWPLGKPYEANIHEKVGKEKPKKATRIGFNNL